MYIYMYIYYDQLGTNPPDNIKTIPNTLTTLVLSIYVSQLVKRIDLIRWLS